MGLLEVFIAILVIGIGATSALSSMLTAKTLDEELAQRDIALKAAVAQMERVLNYANDLDLLMDVCSQPEFATFTVRDLARSGRGPGTGTVVVDRPVPSDVNIQVTVSWISPRGPRSLAIPMFLTETLP